MSIYEQIIDLLKTKNVPFKIHVHEPVLTMIDVETKLPFPKDKLLKTLVFRIKGSSWIYAVVQGRDRVDYKKLSKVFTVNRRDILRPSAQEVEDNLSLQIGGICPIPVQEHVAVVFDNSIKNMGTVFCGVGSNERSLEIDINDLIKVSGAEVRSIIQDKQE